MPIPNADSAVILREKLSEYLLDTSHPIGGSKADWFVSLGYDPDDPDQLANDLLNLVRVASDYVEHQSPFGVKYVVRGDIATPNGQPANVLTVWIVEMDDSEPRLVTAYPDEDANDE